jgi:hypothetical protein
MKTPKKVHGAAMVLLALILLASTLTAQELTRISHT